MAMKEQYYSIEGQMISYKDMGGRKDFLTDALGSVTAEVDETCTKTFEGRYKPYGSDLSSFGPRGKYGWVGTFGYRETALVQPSHYIRARHYTSVSGNWNERDIYWPNERSYAYVVGRSTYAPDPSGNGAGDKGFPSSSLPEGPCDAVHCGKRETTRNPRLSNPQTRPGQEFEINATPFGVGVKWKGTSRQIAYDALWTTTKWKCKCDAIYYCHLPIIFATWVKESEVHCRGTYLKEDIGVFSETIIIREAYYGDGSPGCPKEDRVNGFAQNLMQKLCLKIGIPDYICHAMYPV